MRFFILIFLFSLFSCDNKITISCHTKQNTSIQNKHIKKQSFIYEKIYQWKKYPDTKALIGQFDNDTTIDTLNHVLMDLNTGKRITDVPSEWDSLINYFNFSIHSNNKIVGRGFNQLNLKEGIGLYALINIGDNNSNGIEEIALVKNYFDFSSLNTCLIYEYDNNKWNLLFYFEIHESAFIESVVNREIKDFLIMKNNKWYYRDYQNCINSGIENDFKRLKY